jgi:hypothetical protein
MENFRFDNWVIEDAQKQAFEINNRYSQTTEATLNEKTPIFSNFSFSNITVINAVQVAKIVGLPEKAIEQLRFTDINATGKSGFNVDCATDLELHNLRVAATGGKAFTFDASSNIVFDDVSGNGSTELAQLATFKATTGVRQRSAPTVATP